jgi:hypothetical protein
MPIENVKQLLNMTELPEEELASILRQGVVLRLPFLEGRLIKAEKEVKRFQEKYRTTLDDLKSQGLPEDANFETHEDFIEWEYWDDVLCESERVVRSIKGLLEKLELAVGIH